MGITDFHLRIERVGERALSEKERTTLNCLMRRGVNKNDKTGLYYFTGYECHTLYDWDQYFEGIVQLYMGWGTQYLRNAVKIFLFFQEKDGFTRRTISNSTEGVLPEESEEMVKPFLSQITELCLKYDENLDWLSGGEYEKLQKSLDYWLYERDFLHQNLSVWRSSIETGMDDQHERAGKWGAAYCAGVDLNVYLYRECLAFAAICEYRGDWERAKRYRDIAEDRKRTVQSLWNEEDGFFYDQDVRSGAAIKVKSASGFTPIWVGIASSEQVQTIVERHLQNPREFWRPYFVPVMAATERRYSARQGEGDIGCNWRANVWAPVSYMLMHGLVDYGYRELAERLAKTMHDLVWQSGNREYYDAETGEGLGFPEFWGWTLLGYFMEEELRQDLNCFA